MIQKKREEYQNIEGAGRPFEMNPRYPIEKTNAERQKPIVIHLGDLNGQEGGKGMPKNFVRRAGRILPTFDKYWTSDEMRSEQDDAFDIE
jgi:hypothetical protein